MEMLTDRNICRPSGCLDKPSYCARAGGENVNLFFIFLAAVIAFFSLGLIVPFQSLPAWVVPQH